MEKGEEDVPAFGHFLFPKPGALQGAGAEPWTGEQLLGERRGESVVKGPRI